MAVPAASPAKIVKDFVELAKAGKATNYASLGPGHVGAPVGGDAEGADRDLDLKHIPYQPGPTAVHGSRPRRREHAVLLLRLVPAGGAGRHRSA